MNFHEIKVFIAMHTKQLREWHCFVTLKNTNSENRRNKRGMWHLHNNPWRLRSSNVRLFTTFPRESSYSSYKQNQSKVIKTLQSLGYHQSPSLLLFEMSRAKRSITSQRKGGKETMSSLDHLQIGWGVSGPVVRALDSGLDGPGSSPGWGTTLWP